MEWAHAIRVAGASRDVVVSRGRPSVVLVPWRVLCFRRCRKRRTFFGAFRRFWALLRQLRNCRGETNVQGIYTCVRVYVCTCVRVCNMQITTYVTIVRMRGAISRCVPDTGGPSFHSSDTAITCADTVCTDDLVRWDSALDSASNLHRDIALDSALDTPLLQARGSVVGQDPPPQDSPAMPANVVAHFWA